MEFNGIVRVSFVTLKVVTKIHSIIDELTQKCVLQSNLNWHLFAFSYEHEKVEKKH